MANLIYGRNTVKDALNNVKVDKVYLSQGFSDKSIISLCKEKRIPIVIKSNSELDKMVNGNHQGIVAESQRFEYSSLEEIIRLSKNEAHPLVLLLDEINDPGNFGAIIRSADAFSVAGIIIKKHNQVMVNSTVFKTSTGAINHVKIAQVSNLSQALETLKEHGFWSIATSGEAKTSYADLKYDFPVALIIGNEGDGISPLIIKRADFNVKIPMTGHVNSLNASVAAGIFISYIRSKQ